MAYLYTKRRLLPALAGLFGIVLCLAVFTDTRPSDALETGSWGLSFQETGKLPSSPASPETLAAYDTAFCDPDGGKTLYLTFDAGYENGYTAQILDVLKQHKVPAAFFLVGNYLDTQPELVRRMVEEGHTVGNHTGSHPDMSKITEEAAFRQELSAVEEKYKAITGQELPRFYRPPQGIYSEENLRLAQKMGYKTVFWSLAYADWKNDAQPSHEEAFSKLIPRTHDGAVVLLHSTSKTNAAILDELLTRWKDMGYCFGTLEQLFS